MNDKDELVDALLGMVEQHCDIGDDGIVYSGCLSANAHALRLLCRLGRMRMVNDGIGQSVAARF